MNPIAVVEIVIMSIVGLLPDVATSASGGTTGSRGST